MSRRDQLPVTESDFQDALIAASIVHHTPLSEKERKDLIAIRNKIAPRGYWKPRSLRSASAARGVSRHRKRASRRSTRRRKMHTRKSHRRRASKQKSHRRRNAL